MSRYNSVRCDRLCSFNGLSATPQWHEIPVVFFASSHSPPVGFFASPFCFQGQHFAMSVCAEIVFIHCAPVGFVARCICVVLTSRWLFCIISPVVCFAYLPLVFVAYLPLVCLHPTSSRWFCFAYLPLVVLHTSRCFVASYLLPLVFLHTSRWFVCVPPVVFVACLFLPLFLLHTSRWFVCILPVFFLHMSVWSEIVKI